MALKFDHVTGKLWYGRIEMTTGRFDPLRKPKRSTPPASGDSLVTEGGDSLVTEGGDTLVTE